jgi:predicted Zn-dependent protease
MTEVGVRVPPPLGVPNASVFVGTIATVALLIAALLSLDLFLARLDRSESAGRAAGEYADGVAALRAGRASDAAEHFGIAVGIDRTNVDYSLGLAEAMLQEGRTVDAESTLRTLVDRAENDGAVNLAMAHVMMREGRFEDAKGFLHRAVFGRWAADSVERRNDARFELIDLLVRRGPPAELLAELLPLEAVSPDSVALRQRLGDLFMVAGSPARAANMFRDVLRQDPNNGEAYAGMGRAALALGNLRTARDDFAEAARLLPDDARIASRLALVDTVLALDPTARGVESQDRLSRSRALLARTIAVVAPCAGQSAVLDSAQVLLAPSPTRGRGRSRTAPDAEVLMEAASDVWASRPATCDTAERDEALRLLISRITQ